VSAAIPPLDPTATSMFAACEAAWEDDDRHDKLVKYCAAAGLLASAALRYRQHLDRHPGDALATRMQQRIVALATLSLTTHASSPKPVTRSRWFAVFVALAAIAGAAAAILYRG
jgi:hypothetical protein